MHNVSHYAVRNYRSLASLSIVSVLLLCCVFFAAEAQAQDNRSHPYSTALDLRDLPKLQAQLSRLTETQLSHAPAKMAISPIRLRAKMPKIGRVDFRFSYLALPQWDAWIETESGLAPDLSVKKLRLLIGEAKVIAQGTSTNPRRQRFDSLPASAALIPQGDATETFKLTAHVYNPRRKVTRYYNAEFRRRNGRISPTGKLSHPPSFALAAYTCLAQGDGAVLSHPGDHLPSHAAFQVAAATLREVDIVTDCDVECANLLGSNPNATIAGFLNTVSSIYEAQLGLTFKIKSQITRSSTSVYPPSVTDALTLLELVESRASDFGSGKDAVHLVTGKNISSGVIGLAYVGVMCSPGVFATYGWSRHFSSSLTPIIMAHEIGHNLNAQHTSQGIMTTSLGNPAPSSFSTVSVNQITSYLNTGGNQCLAETGTGSSSSSSSSSTSSSSSSGGSGSIPGTGGDDTPFGNFSVSLSGPSFSAVVTAPSSYTGCTFDFYAGGTRKAAESGNVLLGRINIADGLSGSAAAADIARVKLKNDGSKQYAFFSGLGSCATGGKFYVTPKRLVVSKRKGVTFRKVRPWLLDLQSRLVITTP